jgi:hypothetical protein
MRTSKWQGVPALPDLKARCLAEDPRPDAIRGGRPVARPPLVTGVKWEGPEYDA